MDLENGTVTANFFQYPANNCIQSTAPRTWPLKYEASNESSSFNNIPQESGDNYFPNPIAPVDNTSTYYNGEYQFFNHCEQVAGSGSIGQTTSGETDQYFGGSGLDMDYSMIGSSAAPTTISNDWCAQNMNQYENYASNGSNLANQSQYQQMYY